MKTKKSKKANLENYRTIFLQIGLILVLSAILIAFEWKSNIEYDFDYVITSIYDDSEVIPPVTMPKAETPKKVEAPSFVIMPDEFEVPEFDPEKFSTEIGVNDPFDMPNFDDIEELVEDEPVIIAEFMPTFQGKDLSYFRNYVSKNLVFPERAKETGVVGTVYATFVIDKDGSVTDVQIMRGVHPDVDKAVINVIKNSPRWEPGMNNGRYVKVKFTIPVAFKLI